MTLSNDKQRFATRRVDTCLQAVNRMAWHDSNVLAKEAESASMAMWEDPVGIISRALACSRSQDGSMERVCRKLSYPTSPTLAGGRSDAWLA